MASPMSSYSATVVFRLPSNSKCVFAQSAFMPCHCWRKFQTSDGKPKDHDCVCLFFPSGHLGDEEKNKIPVDVLEVTVHEGTSLLSMDAGGKSDPYCILKYVT